MALAILFASLAYFTSWPYDFLYLGISGGAFLFWLTEDRSL